MDTSHLPWYVTLLLKLGGLALIWKFVQGKVAGVADALTPYAEKGTDVLFAFVTKYPVVRWLLLGSPAKAKELVDGLIEAARALLLVVEKRFDADLDAEASRDASGPKSS